MQSLCENIDKFNYRIMIDTYFRRQNKNGDINLPTNSFLTCMSNLQIHVSIFVLCASFLFLPSFTTLHVWPFCFNFLFNKNYVFIFPLDVDSIKSAHKNNFHCVVMIFRTLKQMLITMSNVKLFGLIFCGRKSMRFFLTLCFNRKNGYIHL